MPATLLVALVGPLQSWGTRSRFLDRDTEREPSKSGVIGLLCAALGRPRNEPVDDLAAARMGVRVDREGRIGTDYHTTGGGYPVGLPTAAGGRRKPGQANVSQRHYLADAAFLVGLEHDDEDLLRACHAALRRPRWQLSLGRKAFPPALPPWIQDGLHAKTDLASALGAHPPLIQDPPRSMRLVVECEAGEGDSVRLDQPFGRSFASREFAPRDVRTTYLEVA